MERLRTVFPGWRALIVIVPLSIYSIGVLGLFPLSIAVVARVGGDRDSAEPLG